MRIPFSKRYRAFPELDRFSDRECEGFVRLATREHSGSEWVNVLTGFVLGAAATIPGMVITQYVSGWVESSRYGWAERASLAITGVGILVSCTMCAVVLMMWYDRWLKRTIVVRLKELRCPGCSYLLLGLAVVDGGIVCPECGQRFDLAERGLSAADVLARGPAPTE